MSDEQRLHYLSIALRVFAVFLMVGIYPLMNWLWPARGARE